jgi:2-dehydropantoate 2-reductase
MKVTIVGAGAIGGLAGAYMTRAGHDVLLVDRWAEHVDALNAGGLKIDGVRGNMAIPVRAATPDRLSSSLDMVFVATKSQHTLDAVRQILPILTPRARRSYQNGSQRAGHHGASRPGGLPAEDGDRIDLNYGGALVDPGHIEFVHEGPSRRGWMEGSRPPRLADLARML